MMTSDSRPFWVRRSVRRVLLAAVLGALPAALVSAQPVAQPRGGLNPDSFYGKETFQGVSVRDSLEAIKKLEDARRMERLKDWNKAADWYQEVIEKYGDRVVPSGTDSKNNIYQYTGIERPVQEQLAKWDKEGLEAYRNRYGSIAQTMLDRASQADQETLSRVMKLYFVTEAGKLAGIRLIELHLENGNFPEAARIADRLLDWHPSLFVERPRVLFRAALAYHLAGDTEKAKQRSEQLHSKKADIEGKSFGRGVVPAEATGTLFGKDVVLADALDQLMGNAPPIAMAVGNNSVRFAPGGNEERSLISNGVGRPGAPMARIDFTPPPATGRPGRVINPNGEEIPRPDASAGVNSGLGVMPAVDNGELYFQDGSRVYAVSLASGVPLPGWMQSYPNSSGQYMIHSWSNSRNQQHTLTLTDTSVLAIMGTGDRAAQMSGRGGSDTGTRLVCLNRFDGKERWVVKPPQMRVPDDQQAVKSLDFSGSPLVVGDNIYLLGRGGKNAASEDCYVMCLDLATGAYKWSCFIASANNNTMYGQMANPDTLSHLAYSSGRVYCLTNLGAAAAIDAYAGTIVWLNIYPRDNAAMNPEMGFQRVGYGRATSGTSAWEFNPVVVSEGKVFLLPTDGRKNLLVYDASSGTELKRIAIDDLGSDSIPAPLLTTIIGVDGNEVFLTGSNLVYCVDWTKHDKNKRTSGVLWSQVFAKEIPVKGWQNNAIRGRGFVTADSVFVCTTTEMKRIERRNPATGKPLGKVRENYPKDRSWDDSEGPGNILVTGDQVIVASAKRVNVYADMTLARKRLDDDVAANPISAEPRLRYAEVMFVAGKHDVAMEKLNETVGLLGGIKGLRTSPERDHLFNDCLMFAMKLQKDKRQDNIDQTLDLVNQLYDLAGAAADGDSQQVNYRVSRARFNVEYKQDGSYEAAIKLYQEILTSARLRTVPLADADAGGATQAAMLAEKEIGAIKKIRSTAYDVFEKEAIEKLAKAGVDPAALKQVADSYPNSNAAGKAMLGAAEAYEEKGDYRLAAHTYGLVLRKYGESQNRTRLLESMARNYLAMTDRSGDRVDTAAGRLAAIVTKLGAGSEKLTKPLKLPNNEPLVDSGVSFSQALKAVQAHRSRAATARLPDFKLIPGPTEDMIDANKKATAEWIAKLDNDPDAKRPPSLAWVKDPFVPAANRLVIENIDAIISAPLELRRAHSRQDRIVVWAGNSLAAFPSGAKEPSAKTDALPVAPKALAWIDGGSAVAAWTNDTVTLMDGNTLQKRWAVALRSLPRIDVVAGGTGSEDTVASRTDDMDDQLLNGGRGIFRRRAVNIRFGGVQPGQPANAVAAGPEQIAFVKPISDRIIVGTTAGQLFAVNSSTGQVSWHTRLSQSGPIDRLLANDDFVVAKVTDSTTTQLVAIDTLTGQLVRRMSFPNDSGNVPVNLALAPDGMLVWTQSDRLCGKDLFETRRELTFENLAQMDEGRQPNQPINVNADGQPFNPIYVGATQPDQLVISEGRILAVTHGGKYVSVHSLESGKLLDYTNEAGRSLPFRLSTVGTGTTTSSPAPTDWAVSLNVVGQQLYVVSRQGGPVAYNLDRLAHHWSAVPETRVTPSFLYQEPMIGQDHLIVLSNSVAKMAKPNPNPVPGAMNPNLGQPMNAPGAAGANGRAPTNFTMYVYTRATTRGGSESGRFECGLNIRDDAGITDWEPVDGGIYYLAADKKLHFLKGGKQ